MPNAKVLSEKQAIVADLTNKLQNAAAGVLVDYKGMAGAASSAGAPCFSAICLSTQARPEMGASMVPRTWAWSTGSGGMLARASTSSRGMALPSIKPPLISNRPSIFLANLTNKLQNAAAGVLVDYKGITVAEDTALRAELRKNNVEYAVVKNTLLRFAVNNCGMSELDSLLNGTTSVAICQDDPVAPARVINDFAKKIDGRFEIKGGFMDGKAMPLDEREPARSAPERSEPLLPQS